MADHIIQSALEIGGDTTDRGVLTIAPSDADGNPLMLTNSIVPFAQSDGEHRPEWIDSPRSAAAHLS